MTEFRPNSWRSIDFRKDLDRETADGFLSGPTTQTLSAAPDISDEAGEVWQIRTVCYLEEEPEEDFVAINYKDDDDATIARGAVEDFGGIEISVSTIVESDDIGNDMDIEIEVEGDEDIDFFAFTESYRLRRPSGTEELSTASGDDFTS